MSKNRNSEVFDIFLNRWKMTVIELHNRVEAVRYRGSEGAPVPYGDVRSVRTSGSGNKRGESHRLALNRACQPLSAPFSPLPHKTEFRIVKGLLAVIQLFLKL